MKRKVLVRGWLLKHKEIPCDIVLSEKTANMWVKRYCDRPNVSVVKVEIVEVKNDNHKRMAY